MNRRAAMRRDRVWSSDVCFSTISAGAAGGDGGRGCLRSVELRGFLSGKATRSARRLMMRRVLNQAGRGAPMAD